MNVVVSAIVDPWVTTFSFVVALAMRIQGREDPSKDQNPNALDSGFYASQLVAFACNRRKAS